MWSIVDCSNTRTFTALFFLPSSILRSSTSLNVCRCFSYERNRKKKHFNSKVEENYIEPGAHNWTMSSGGALLPTNVDRTLRFYTSNVNLTKVEKQSLNDWTTGYLGNWLILFPSNLAFEQVYLSKFRENFPRTSKNEPACMLPRIGGDSGATNLLFPSRP